MQAYPDKCQCGKHQNKNWLQNKIKKNVEK
jgi:hypothetical protein